VNPHSLEFWPPSPTYPWNIKLALALGSESSKTNGMLTSSHCILNLIPMVYRTLLPMCSWLSTHRKPNPLDPCLKFRAKKILSWNIDPLSMNIEPFTYNIMNPMIFWTQHLPMGYHTLDSESEGVWYSMSNGSKYYRQGVQYIMEGSKYSIAVLLNSLFKTRGIWYSMGTESKYHG
jgi:hypothetical protein